MSAFNVLPSGVNTFFPTFWKHPDALFKKGLWLAAYPLPNSMDDGVPSAEIHHRLQQRYGEECLSRIHVFEWCKCIREGRERVENEPHDRRTTTPSSRLFGSGYATNHKPFLKRASGCFQNVGKNVSTPEGSTLKADMCK